GHLRVMHARQGGGHVSCRVPVYLADESQGQVQLVGTLPAGTRNTAHGGKQQNLDGVGRVDADKQAHGAALPTGGRGRSAEPQPTGTSPSRRGGKGKSSPWPANSPDI